MTDKSTPLGRAEAALEAMFPGDTYRNKFGNLDLVLHAEDYNKISLTHIAGVVLAAALKGETND